MTLPMGYCIKMFPAVLLMAGIYTTAGFNIWTTPVYNFTDNDKLFGQTIIKSGDGIFVPSPTSGNVFECTLNNGCNKLNISVEMQKNVSPRPITSVSSSLSEEEEQLLVCNQARIKKKFSPEKLNGLCTLVNDKQQKKINPAELVSEQLKRNETNTTSKGHSRNRRQAEQDAGDGDKGENAEDTIIYFRAEIKFVLCLPEDPGTEIAFVLDGSGSIEPEDFELAKDFISTVMRNVWSSCSTCKFAVVQFGNEIRTELSLQENDDAAKALNKVKSITQLGKLTKTADALYHVLTEVFVPEKGSTKNARKMIILLSDGEMTGIQRNLNEVLNMPQMNGVLRFAIGVGPEVQKSKKAVSEMTEIAGSPQRFFKVSDYAALETILSQIEKNIKDPGTEIAFVLDGSGSIEPTDFELAKDFISTVMKDTWSLCSTCKFAVVQFGNEIRTELSLQENDDAAKALNKVKSITQLGMLTKTADALYHVLTEVFVPEKGSTKNARKMIILLSDGEMTGKQRNLNEVLNMPQMNGVLRFAIGVGAEINKSTKAQREMTEIAGSPERFFYVSNYAALEKNILSYEGKSIFHVEEPVKRNDTDDTSKVHSRRRRQAEQKGNDMEEDEDDEDPGTEIAFVLDGSGSIEPPDFELAKDFISTVMRNVWSLCFTCNFAIVQFGNKTTVELSLKENEDGTKALNKVKSITQLGELTKTADALYRVLTEVYVPENGSKKNARKIIIVLSDGEMTGIQRNLTEVLNMPQMNEVLRYSIGVGAEVNKSEKAQREMTEIAGSPDRFFFVSNYAALEKILSEIETNIVDIEGIKKGVGFQFELAEAGFSSHLTHEGSMLFGAVGAYDWSGGIILKREEEDKVKFLNVTKEEPRFSYLGYSVTSARMATKTLYISGAPRYNLTGAVFIFDETSQDSIEGDQVGSYFGSVLCALDIDNNKETDYLLVGAPHFHVKGEEGKVLVYKLREGKFEKENYELHGMEIHNYARFGSAIADIGDIDGNKYNDIAIGAPLEAAHSGSIYIYNVFKDGVKPEFSQRIAPSDFGMKLMHFGQAVSAMFNSEKNKEIFISVGSEGAVNVFKTVPVIVIEPNIEVNPEKIALDKIDHKFPVTVSICFNDLRRKIESGETLSIEYQIEVDPDKKEQRVLDSHGKKNTFILTKDQNCINRIALEYMGCFDCFTPIKIKVIFTVPPTEDGIPVRVLDAFSQTESIKEIPFQKKCTDLSTCQPKISLDNSEASTNMIIIGFTESLSIHFDLLNTGYESYLTTLTLNYPKILQSKGGQCEAKDDLMRCSLMYPVFKANAKTAVSVAWQTVNMKTNLSSATIHAVLTGGHDGTVELASKTYEFEVKHALDLQFTGTATPNLFTIEEGEKSHDPKDLKFSFKLLGENKYKAELTVIITIPKQIDNTKLQIKSVDQKICTQNDAMSEDYHIECNLIDLQDINIEAIAIIGDIKDSKQKIIAKAKLQFDEKTFHRKEQKNTETVEVIINKLVVVKSTAPIIGGSIGGILLLIILIIILIKCGFFRRRRHMERTQSVH
ncbi:hypothetical protein NFI96_013908 [Prochilodus magdalenae]|nr:hypothetical protein NFI96_013908 [Prochilodus magdalenae]